MLGKTPVCFGPLIDRVLSLRYLQKQIQIIYVAGGFMALDLGGELLPERTGTPLVPPLLPSGQSVLSGIKLSLNPVKISHPRREFRFGYPFELRDISSPVAARYGALTISSPEQINLSRRFIVAMACKNSHLYVEETGKLLDFLLRHFGKNPWNKKFPPLSVITLFQLPYPLLYFKRRKLFRDVIKVLKKEHGKEKVCYRAGFF